MSAQIKTKIVSIIRSDFDQTPKNWNGDDWYDNAEEVADDIIALFSSPAPSAVEELIRRLLPTGVRGYNSEDNYEVYDPIRLEAATALSTLAADKARVEAERDRWKDSAEKAMKALAEEDDEARAAEARASALEGEVANLIVAWESLPGGRNYPTSTVAGWLVGPMKAAFDRARAAIRKETP